MARPYPDGRKSCIAARRALPKSHFDLPADVDHNRANEGTVLLTNSQSLIPVKTEHHTVAQVPAVGRDRSHCHSWTEQRIADIDCCPPCQARGDWNVVPNRNLAVPNDTDYLVKSSATSQATTWSLDFVAVEKDASKDIANSRITFDLIDWNEEFWIRRKVPQCNLCLLTHG